MNSILKKGYAKINLFLDVEGCRPDGYHNIISIMQRVDWFDEVEITKTNSDKITVESDSAEIPNDRENIAYRAVTRYLAAVGQMSGIHVAIKKNIPVAAGMAGGSADAAAVLVGMNELFDYALDEKALYQVGATIGADIPFCISGGTKIVKGIGDILEPCSAFPDCTILCAKAGDGVSTPVAYSLLDEKYDHFTNRQWQTAKFEALLSGIQMQNAEKASTGFFNVFENVIAEQKPHVSRVKTLMLNHGAYASMMSGSGPSVFGLFCDKTSAEQACELLQKNGAMAKVCRPLP